MTELIPPAQRERALITVRKYIRQRDVMVISEKRDDLAFMRMCNNLAKELEAVLPSMSFGETALLYVEFDSMAQGRKIFGADPQWSEFDPEDRVGMCELLGTLLGLLRMASGG